MQQWFCILFFSLLLFSCASKRIISPRQADVDRMKTQFPDYTLTDLNKGKALYEGNCGNCHRLKDPAKKTADKWEATVERMVKKINKKEEKVSSEAQELILRYLSTYSKQD